jgi:hypothetical protein
MSNDIDNFLLGGGGASAKFDNVGDTVTGTIVSAEVKDQTDIQTGKPLTWDNGDVRKQLVVRLQTAERDPADPDDDGIRTVYVKGSKKPGSRSLHDAVASAVRAAGGKSLEVGGTLTVTHDGTEPSQTRGFSDRKLYAASYRVPDRAAQASEFLGATPQAPPAPAAPAVAPPAAAPAPAPAAPAMTPEQVAAFAAWQASQGQQAG